MLNSLFSLFYVTGECYSFLHRGWTRLVEFSDSDFEKLVANAVPESTKKSTKYAVNVIGGEESYE